MTVLQKIIKAFVLRKDGMVSLGNEHEAQKLDEAIGVLKSFLPAEEQQIRDAFKAGDKFGYCEATGEIENKPSLAGTFPGIEDYLTHLKAK